MATVATESLVILRERIAESETTRVAAEAEVEFLRGGRLKLLSEISELRASLDTATVTGNMHSPLLYLPMLIPFTVLQIRMTNRSFAAHDQQRAAKVVSFRLEKFQRTEAA